MCEPALKLISVTTSGKQCGPQVASVPFDRRTWGAGGGGELGGLLLGGCDVECDVDGRGVGVAEVGAGWLDDRDADLRCRADFDAVGEGVRVRVAELDVAGCRVGPADV